MDVDVQQITGNAMSVKSLLTAGRYGLDYYQREYIWKETQVRELIDDLVDCFNEQFDQAHERPQVASYQPYFLGPIVTAKRDGVRYLVDGQQRITTLSLLLLFLRSRLLDDHRADGNALDSLIFATSYGRTTFNLDVDERTECLQAIRDGQDFDTSEEPESVRNLWERYHTIVDRFPDDLLGNTLPYFVDWLQNRVILVDISAPNQDMALEIFETMNDRGLRLTNTDMLKSYLLARVREDLIPTLNDRWRHRVTELQDAEENADAKFIRAWLRGNYAETQRERKAKASPRDFDIIGTAFHKWVRDNADKIGLERGADYQEIVEREFLGLSNRYLELLSASQQLRPGLEAVYYNAQTGFTLQLTVILAAITPDDDQDTFREKAALIAGALDIYVARRIVSHRNFGYNTVVYTMFNLMKRVRNRTPEEVRAALTDWLGGEGVTIDAVRSFVLTKQNRKRIHYFLARITAWLDGQLETGRTFADYVDQPRKNPFEVEHIWANHFERHCDEFDNRFEFEAHRNKVGALLLLPKDFNASFGDKPYDQKVEHYYGQNPLARSLNPTAYENNPSFMRLCRNHALSFKAYPTTFHKADIDERQELYRQLAGIVWDPARLGLG